MTSQTALLFPHLHDTPRAAVALGVFFSLAKAVRHHRGFFLPSAYGWVDAAGIDGVLAGYGYVGDAGVGPDGGSGLHCAREPSGG
jgi:hypothetical protein